MNVAGNQAEVRWQASQLCVVGICVDGLPVAVLPLWQVEQLPAVTVLWSKLAGSQAVVRWQLSQLCVVGTCVAGLPVAVLPLWQVAQLPGVTVL